MGKSGYGETLTRKALEGKYFWNIRSVNNHCEEAGIFLYMKKLALCILALSFLAPLVPAAGAQVVVRLGDDHHHHRHCWYSHHHRHCR
jgi:hypothetical protein